MSEKKKDGRANAPRPERRSGTPPALAEWMAACPLRRARLERRLTQKVIGMMARPTVSEVTVRAIEQGSTKDYERSVTLLAHALGKPELVSAYQRWRKRMPTDVDAAAAS